MALAESPWAVRNTGRTRWIRLRLRRGTCTSTATGSWSTERLPGFTTGVPARKGVEGAGGGWTGASASIFPCCACPPWSVPAALSNDWIRASGMPSSRARFAACCGLDGSMPSCCIRCRASCTVIPRFSSSRCASSGRSSRCWAGLSAGTTAARATRRTQRHGMRRRVMKGELRSADRKTSIRASTGPTGSGRPVQMDARPSVFGKRHRVERRVQGLSPH